ncbi:DUF6185 family protein [Streptomyces sp. H39-S7]|nr:DUF6185 family protein [Streptomyces sp. H39-S7]MCZ4125054.1 DUF6185 family protein [Streptomyces sp. H39-S7]
MSLGPAKTPWGNGLQGTVIATILGLPVICYVLKTYYYGSWWTSQFATNFGPLWMTYNALFVVLPWAASGFLLGFFWRELPGKLGPIKALTVSLALTAGMGVNNGLCFVLDQQPPNYRWGVTVLLIAELMLTGILLDAFALKNQRPFWGSLWNPLFSVYRLGAAQTGLAFVVAQIAALVGLWLQVRGGLAPSDVNPVSPTGNK